MWILLMIIGLLFIWLSTSAFYQLGVCILYAACSLFCFFSCMCYVRCKKTRKRRKENKKFFH